MTRGLLAHGRLWGTVAFLAVALVAAELSGLRSNFSLDAVRQVFQAHWLWGIVVFTGLFVLGNLIHVPGLVFLFAAVLALGKLQGGLVTYLAANVSCLVTFLVYRWLGGDMLLRVAGRWPRRLMAGLHAHPLRSMVLLRTFFQTMPTLNMALGLSGLRLRHYAAGTALGLPLPIAVYCVFFDLLAQGAKSL